MKSDKMKLLAEQMKKGTVVNQEKKEENLKESPASKKESKTQNKSKSISKGNTLENLLINVKEKNYVNKERVYIDNNLSQKLKLLKLSTGISIGNLANIMIEKVMEENKVFLNKMKENIFKN